MFTVLPYKAKKSFIYDKQEFHRENENDSFFKKLSIIVDFCEQFNNE